MHIIDAHCHIYPDKIAEKATAATEVFYGINHTELNGTTSLLLSEGEKAGITHFIVQSVATSPAQVSSINRFIAGSVAESNGKFTGLGTLHPDSDDIRRDVEEIISLGLKGVKLHPDIQKFKADDYRCLKIYQECEGRLPILMHTGDNRYDNSNPNRLKPLLEIYTGLTVIGAHFGGWSMWEDATKLLANEHYDNFYVDCSSSFYSLTDDEIIKLISSYGDDRVLFGSDYPMWSPVPEVKRFLSLNLPEKTQEKILYKNACRLFDIKLEK
ncbi:MAG: amidohydrolase family protein [Clostridia bacterium]|nr:amidohydrolase family protein [Clostridia bacterium]